MVTMLTPSTGDIVNGYPKPICSVFPGLPSNIDAALSWKNIRATFFFKVNTVDMTAKDTSCKRVMIVSESEKLSSLRNQIIS